jgi:hypothetical protein
MGKYTQWITHKGKRILFVNAARLGEAETLASLEEMKQELLRERPGPLPLTLVDISGIDMTAPVAKKAREVTADTKAPGVQDAPNAVVGMTGLQKAVAQLFSRNARFTDSIEEAKEWLVKEDGKRHKD